MTALTASCRATAYSRCSEQHARTVQLSTDPVDPDLPQCVLPMPSTELKAAQGNAVSSDERPADATRLRMIDDLREFIVALKTRTPHAERAGEVAIAADAAALKGEALKRLAELLRPARAPPPL